MRQLLKRLAARLPGPLQLALKRRYYANQIRMRSFRTSEPEYEMLPQMVSSGDWVLDIGANVGHYTLRLSELVGQQGRVISLEPVPETFELLVANAALSKCKNITLINAAGSESTGVSGMVIPKDEDGGLDNLYLAHLSETAPGLQVLCIAVDSLDLSHPVRLVKVDTEGHELSVLRGMKGLLERDHPTLIVEDNDPEVGVYLAGFRYASEKLANSSNTIFRSPEGATRPA